MTRADSSASAPDLTAANLRAALRQVIDPEVGLNIVDLGLVYRVELDAQGALVEMTMTSPACPMGDMILEQVRDVLSQRLPPTIPLDLRLVWTPAWDPGMMSHAAKLQLGW